jgi:hypothetical protein
MVHKICGTGFNNTVSIYIERVMGELTMGNCTFSRHPNVLVKPKLLANIAFGEWIGTDRLSGRSSIVLEEESKAHDMSNPANKQRNINLDLNT